MPRPHTPTPTEPAPAAPDKSALVFTGTPAQMASQGLSFTGLKSISLVTVPTTSGKPVRALKISADSITITGFSLSVRPEGGPGLVTDASTISVHMGLIGSIGYSISYSDTDQRIVQNR